MFLTNMTLMDYEQELMSYSDFKAHKILSLYIPPLLVTVGTIGNLLSLYVLLQKEMRKTSTYNYLAVIALMDMIILYIGLLRKWIHEVTGAEIKNSSDWSCKIINFLGYSVMTYSVWLIIAVTVERYIVTVHSLNAITMCTQSRALKIITGLLIIFLSIHLHFLWTSKLVTNNNTGEEICLGANGYEHLIDRIWPWVDIFLYCLIPFFLIIIFNSLIIHKVVKSNKNRSSLGVDSGSRLSRGSNVSSTNGLVGEKSVRVTVMLLCISFAFLVCTLPMSLLMIKLEIWSTSEYSKEDVSRYYLFRTLCELLMYTNHSINFYLYLLTGKKFRKQLFEITFNRMCKKDECEKPVLQEKRTKEALIYENEKEQLRDTCV